MLEYDIRSHYLYRASMGHDTCALYSEYCGIDIEETLIYAADEAVLIEIVSSWIFHRIVSDIY